MNGQRVIFYCHISTSSLIPGTYITGTWHDDDSSQVFFYALNQLWPLLRKTSRKGDGPKPRVVFLSSEQHRGTYY
jgi:hypothetical protein